MIKLNLFKITMFCMAMLFAFTACNRNKKFDKQQWAYTDGIDYPLRDKMVNDLVDNHPLKGLKYSQVIQLLGYPQGNDSISFYYQIENTYTNTGKRDQLKKLIFYMGKDSIITKTELYDNTPKK
jgi:hypothetical protein